ncbi:NAD(P)H-dependent oxidoreductase [bacterium]|jgi:chromate reductase, NAD(P)H dehydrogenase (quinone)|nr:NAD(P)H-dependent oxidoreductase [bacterium]
MKKIIILLASQGQNPKLAESFKSEINNMGVEASILDLISLDLSLYSTREQKNKGIPDCIPSIVKTLEDTSGFIFVSPEYNGGVPPVLSNFIAWVSVSQKNWRDSFNDKPAILASFSASCGHHMLTSLRIQLAHIGMTVLGREVTASFKKELNMDSVTQVCSSLVRSI